MTNYRQPKRAPGWRANRTRRAITCVDCGAIETTRAARKVRCIACADRRKRNRDNGRYEPVAPKPVIVEPEGPRPIERSAYTAEMWRCECEWCREVLSKPDAHPAAVVERCRALLALAAKTAGAAPPQPARRMPQYSTGAGFAVNGGLHAGSHVRRHGA